MLSSEVATISGYGYKFDFEASSFIDVDLEASEMGRGVLPVVVRSPDGSVRKEGTAFVVFGTIHHEMVVATAKHVLQSAIDDPQASDLMVLVPSADDINHLIGVRPNLVGLADDFSDVALMVFDLATAAGRVTPTIMPLSVREPEVGKPCMALGYGGSAHDTSAANGLELFLSASRGEITQIHNPMRDKSLSTFPTFEVAATYAPGMSGGPIVDMQGDVIGIVSHGFDGAEIAYGACTAALLELKVNLTTDEGDVRTLNVIDIVGRTLFPDVDDTVTLDRADDGLTLIWSSSRTRVRGSRREPSHYR